MIIYKAINKINGKIYIGQTMQTLEGRTSHHYSDARRGKGKTYFHMALLKYQPEDFMWETICCCNSIDELNICEEYWIAFYDSTNRNKGYNLKKGGYNKTHSEETRLKISEGQKGRKAFYKGKKQPLEMCVKRSITLMGHYVSEETKRKISQKATGRKVSKETKAKMSKTRKGHITTEETRAKLSMAKIGIKRESLSEEWRQRISQSLLKHYAQLKMK
jgi:group I intron endonuclease